jgi:hypothetical protein
MYLVQVEPPYFMEFLFNTGKRYCAGLKMQVSRSNCVIVGLEHTITTVDDLPIVVPA